MATKKTLGGDRVGSEGKMKVQLHGFKRSTHNIGFAFMTDQGAGPLVPNFVDIATPGTDYYIKNINTIIRTLPTLGPIFGRFKHQIDFYKIPIRLYIGALHNNKLGVGLKMQDVKFPVAKYTVRPTRMGYGNDGQVAPDSLTKYLGISGFGTWDGKIDGEVASGNITRTMHALFELAYWDIYKNYYANKQEEIGYVINGRYNLNNDSEILIERTDRITGEARVDGNNIYGKPIYESGKKVGFEIIQQVSVGGAGVHEGYTQNPTNLSKLTIFTNEESGDGVGHAAVRALIINGKMNGEKVSMTVQELINAGIINDNIDGDTEWIYPLEFNVNNLTVETITSSVSEQSGIELTKFELKNIDDMREAILKASGNYPFIVNEGAHAKMPYMATMQKIKMAGDDLGYVNGCAFHQAGLGIKTYLSDRFNNWLQTEWLDGENGINEITAVTVVDGKISMDALIMQKKMYDSMNRIAISGGSYYDWQEVAYDVKIRGVDEAPIYMGGMSSEISFDEVVQTAPAETTKGESVLGALGGRGSDKGHEGGKNIHIHVDEPCIIMAIESITPRVMYAEGNSWHYALENMNDLHQPSFDGIGFQELITEEMGAYDTRIGENENNEPFVTKFSAGKQPAWIQYQTNVDKVFGSFAPGESLDYMAITRKYHPDENNRIADLTTYIDPVIYNGPFTQTDLQAKNFWVFIGMNIEVRRKMSANQIPNL